LILAALASAAVPALAQNAAPAKLNSDGAKFGMREGVEHIGISPDGTRLAYVAPGRGRLSELYVVTLATGDQKRILQSSGNPERLRWCNFVSNDRLVCQISGLVREPGGLLIPFTRLFSVGDDGKDIKQLGQRRSSYDAGLRQFDGAILDWLPGQNGSVLMSRQYIPEEGKIGSLVVRTDEGLGVDRIDVRSLDVKRIEKANKEASSFMTDGRGNVRIMQTVSTRGATGQLGQRTEFYYRPAGASGWKEFASYNYATREGMVPVAVDATLNSAYVLKKLNGRFALYRVKLDGSMAAELVYKNDKVDVDDVVRAGRGSKVIGVTFAEESQRVVYFDEEYKRLSASLGKALPNLPIVNFEDWSADGKKVLLFAGSDSDPGRYYILDKDSKSLSQVIAARPLLEDVKLATVKHISYPGADGTMIPAYLTLPVGREAKGLPAIVLPHGGPSARDVWGFDWLSQFFASQGYAVIQPNYRGSDGYGDEWLKKNGFQSWQTSISDVTASARWLASQGIADPAKLAVVGWSYGGYAALQSGVLDPQLFKAIVAIAPVSDLGLLKAEAKDYTSSRNVAEYIGSGPHIEQGSPARNAARIAAPVLMFHGDMDLNVGLGQSRRMDRALKDAGKRSELVVYEGLEHGIVDSNARAQMLDKIAVFLKASMGS
jgi:dipeptidyl aminopeptidase/acylaminoacyl peptidase